MVKVRRDSEAIVLFTVYVFVGVSVAQMLV